MKTICWIGEAQPSQLAIVLRPHGDFGLQADLEALKADGIDLLVSLLTPEDEAELGLGAEKKIAGDLGLRFIAYPIPDRQTPSDLAGFRRLIAGLCDEVRAGRKIGAHCRGCIGRSTILIASILIELGWEPMRAVSQIQDARGCSVPDTPGQLEWILEFDPRR